MNMTDNRLASPEQIFEFVQAIILQPEDAERSEQRISERRPTYLPVELQFIDNLQQPIGSVVPAVTKDISVGGMGLISAQAAIGPNVIVSFSTPTNSVSVMLEIRHNTPIGPFFQMGGPFCADWTATEF